MAGNRPERRGYEEITYQQHRERVSRKRARHILIEIEIY
jgi:hypothetical protein